MNRNEYIHFRATVTERAMLQALAEYEGRKASETLREVIREAAERRGLWPHPIPINLAPMQEAEAA